MVTLAGASFGALQAKATLFRERSAHRQQAHWSPVGAIEMRRGGQEDDDT